MFESQEGKGRQKEKIVRKEKEENRWLSEDPSLYLDVQKILQKSINYKSKKKKKANVEGCSKVSKDQS